MRLINIIDTEKFFEIPDENGEYIIGRSNDIAVTVRSKSLSGEHCKITVRNNKFFVTDLGSSNGTFVNGNRVKQAVLKDNSILQLGAIKFRIEMTDEAEEKQDEIVVVNDSKDEIEVVDQQPETVNVAAHVDVEKAAKQKFPDRKAGKYSQTRKKVPTKSQKKIKDEKPSPKVSSEKGKPDDAKTFKSNNLWISIFLVGVFVGILLIAISFILKSGSDAEVKQLKTEIKTLKDDKTILQNSIRISKRKIEEFTTTFSEFKTEISTATDNINNAQRAIMTDVKNVKTLSDEIADSIKTIEAGLRDIDNKIENLSE